MFRYVRHSHWNCTVYLWKLSYIPTETVLCICENCRTFPLKLYCEFVKTVGHSHWNCTMYLWKLLDIPTETVLCIGENCWTFPLKLYYWFVKTVRHCWSFLSHLHCDWRYFMKIVIWTPLGTCPLLYQDKQGQEVISMKGSVWLAGWKGQTDCQTKTVRCCCFHVANDMAV